MGWETSTRSTSAPSPEREPGSSRTPRAQHLHPLPCRLRGARELAVGEDARQHLLAVLADPGERRVEVGAPIRLAGLWDVHLRGDAAAGIDHERRRRVPAGKAEELGEIVVFVQGDGDLVAAHRGGQDAVPRMQRVIPLQHVESRGAVDAVAAALVEPERVVRRESRRRLAQRLRVEVTLHRGGGSVCARAAQEHAGGEQSHENAAVVRSHLHIMPERLPPQPPAQPPPLPAVEPPSLLVYAGLVIAGGVLISAGIAASNERWAGLWLNLATELIGAVIILIIVERRLRAAEVTVIGRRLLFVFSREARQLVSYATVLTDRITAISIRPYMDRGAVEEQILEESGRGGGRSEEGRVGEGG